MQCNNQLMKKIRTWQLCRTGTFGADGATITEQDLKDIESTFVPPRPISIGHEAARADNFPKFGDVLAIDGIYPDAKHPGEKVLVGKVVLHPELEKQFDDKGDGNGTYEGWSVTIPKRASDGKRYLHSLAICGRTPPKINGLEQLMVKNSYSDKDTVESFEFSDSIEYEEDSSMTEEEKKKMEALEAEKKRLEEELAKAKKSDDEKTAKDAEDDELHKKEFADMAARCERLEKEAKTARVKNVTDKFSDVIPANLMPKVKAVAEKLADCSECEFADDAGNKKASALEIFADVLLGMKEQQKTNSVLESQFEAGEFSDKGTSGKERVNPADIAAKM